MKKIICLIFAAAIGALACTPSYAEADRTITKLLHNCESDGKTSASAIELGDCIGYIKGLYDATRVLGNVFAKKCLVEDSNTLERVGLAVETLKQQPVVDRNKFAAPVIIGVFIAKYQCPSPQK